MRLCIVLAYHEGMTHEEITTLTEIPLGTVKSNISRGSARLRELLAGYGTSR
jgi:DNA-directed RNA polymerase specialized sigma24 family protein